MFKSAQKLALTLTFSALAATAAHAQQGWRFEVTITNITAAQTFTPQLVVSHDRNASVFQAGEPASDALEILAEDGNTAPLTSSLADVSNQANTIDGLLEPGQSSSTIIRANPWRHTLSLAAMLIPTNDTFVALNGVELPRRGVATFMAPAYDAGTEINDQACANIPGPRCGGEGLNEEGGEGFVHISNGFHNLEGSDGVNILGAQVYDWRNPVARITVRRVR